MEVGTAHAPGADVSYSPEPDLLPACRAGVRREGAQSAEARALFRQFYDAWYRRVETWAAARIGHFYAQDLAVETFWRAWQWLLGPSDLPGPGSLLNTCLERAYVDMMRSLYGRCEPASGDATTPGADARFPLSADRVDADTQALIRAIASEADVEVEVLRRARARLVRQGLASIASNYRECVRCRYMLGMSVHDTAVELGLTADQVKKRTASGLAQLARVVLDHKDL